MVWEETIILLPDNVHYVFLSATIPNATQFAEWVCHLHHQVSRQFTPASTSILAYSRAGVQTVLPVPDFQDRTHGLCAVCKLETFPLGIF